MRAVGHQAEPGEAVVGPVTDDDPLARARARIEAFHVLGVDVPALATRLARAEAAAAAGESQVAQDLCDEIGVLTALVRREVVRALGSKLPAAGRAEATGPAPSPADLAAEIDRRVGDALATARERWAQAATAQAVEAVAASVDEKLPRRSAAPRWPSARSRWPRSPRPPPSRSCWKTAST